MNTIFGIPADTLMYTLLGLLGLIFLGVALTALRYPLPFRLGVRNSGHALAKLLDPRA